MFCPLGEARPTALSAEKTTSHRALAQELPPLGSCSYFSSSLHPNGTDHCPLQSPPSVWPRTRAARGVVHVSAPRASRKPEARKYPLSITWPRLCWTSPSNLSPKWVSLPGFTLPPVGRKKHCRLVRKQDWNLSPPQHKSPCLLPPPLSRSRALNEAP